MTHHSAKIWNFGLYQINEHYNKTGKYLPYQSNTKNLLSCFNYKMLPSAVAQQTLKVLDKSFQSYFALNKLFSEGKLPEKPSQPKYKKKQSFFNLQYSTNGFQHKPKLEILNLAIPTLFKTEYNLKNLSFKLPSFISQKKIVEAKIIPNQIGTEFRLVVTYKDEEKKEKKEKLNLDKSNILGIDLGINNFCSISTTTGKGLLIDGRGIKSVNHRYNQRKAEIQSSKEKNKIKGKTRIECIIERNRKNKINDYLHKTARLIVNMCLRENIGLIVCGYNQGWKNEVSIGKVNNQNFVQIPHGRFVEMLKFKCFEEGIELRLINESYTSKCSYLDNEIIGKHENYLGKRVKRGLFVSGDGTRMNSDMNGSFNILRKATGKGWSEMENPDLIKAALIQPRKLRSNDINKYHSILMT